MLVLSVKIHGCCSLTASSAQFTSNVCWLYTGKFICVYLIFTVYWPAIELGEYLRFVLRLSFTFYMMRGHDTVRICNNHISKSSTKESRHNRLVLMDIHISVWMVLSNPFFKHIWLPHISIYIKIYQFNNIYGKGVGLQVRKLSYSPPPNQSAMHDKVIFGSLLFGRFCLLILDNLVNCSTQENTF